MAKYIIKKELTVDGDVVYWAYEKVYGTDVLFAGSCAYSIEGCENKLKSIIKKRSFVPEVVKELEI